MQGDQAMSTEPFDFEAGALCLDFANTVAWHASEQPEDRLDSYLDLVRWGEGAGILTPGRAAKLRQVAREEAGAAAATFAEAVRLREALYRIFAAVADEDEVAGADLDLLNDHLARALSHLKVVPAAPAFSWAWQERSHDLHQILWPVARSAANLLTGDRDTLDRVGQCADDRGCGYLFVDSSRNRSRRWCSMESCGNRAKVHRHYLRQREEQDHNR